MVPATKRVRVSCGQPGSAIRTFDSIGATLADRRPSAVEFFGAFRARTYVKDDRRILSSLAIPFCSAVAISNAPPRERFRQRTKLTHRERERADSMEVSLTKPSIKVPHGCNSHVLFRANAIVSYCDKGLVIERIVAAEGIPLGEVPFDEMVLEHPGGLYAAAGAYCREHAEECPWLGQLLNQNGEFVQNPKALFRLFGGRSRPLVVPSREPIDVGGEMYSARELGVPERCLQSV